jgi:hypothetical protein
VEGRGGVEEYTLNQLLSLWALFEVLAKGVGVLLAF